MTTTFAIEEVDAAIDRVVEARPWQTRLEAIEGLLYGPVGRLTAGHELRLALQAALERTCPTCQQGTPVPHRGLAGHRRHCTCDGCF